MAVKDRPVGTCPVCRGVTDKNPPVTPLTASVLITSMGENNQVVVDNWLFFIDDSEMMLSDQVYTEKDTQPLLSAVCLCGSTIKEPNESFRSWFTVTDK